MDLNQLSKIIDDYYPKGIDLNSPELLENPIYLKLVKLCINASNNRDLWNSFLNNLKKDLNVEITEFVFLEKLNPSFIAVFLVNDYADSKLSSYQPCQLVLKISALAPIYSIRFDNLISDWNKRIVRINSVNEKELFVFNEIEENIKKYYSKFSAIDSSKDFQVVDELGNISISNTRKAYIDECIFGLYLSFHPHNIFQDRFQSKEYEIIF